MAPDKPSFWDELRRRRVVRSVSLYAVVAWVAVQVADVFFPALNFPDWTVTVVAVLAVIGFPITVAVAWVYDRTAEGLERTAPSATDLSRGGSGLGRQFFSALALGAVAGMLVVGTVFWLAGSSDRGTVVAVLPFETMGDANPTFTEGIHGDVLTGLSGVTGLDVISRGSVERYADPDRPVAEVAEELGVGWVLRGEVQQAGRQVQVHARLVDARRDRQIWAEAFRAELTAANLFDIQQEITDQIVAAFQDRFARGEGDRARRESTEDLDAYRFYVQGRDQLGPREEASMRRALELFDQAIARDSTYAAAWAGLADALTYLETFGFQVPDGVIDARQAAERALSLNPRLAEAHFALANLAHARRDNAEAVRRIQRAIELRPSYSDAYNLLSWIDKLHGRTDPALDAALRAVELDPLGSAPLSNLSLAYLALGRPAEALDEARRLRGLHPNFPTARFLEALALVHQGRFQEAPPLLEDLGVAWADPGPRATLAVVRAAMGQTEEARELGAAIAPEAHPFSSWLVRRAVGDPAPVTELTRVDRWEYWPTYAVRYFFPGLLDALRETSAFQGVLESVDESWR